MIKNATKNDQQIGVKQGLKTGKYSSVPEEVERAEENDTRVVVIAEHSYVQDGVSYTYCCEIYEQDGNVYAR